MDNDNYTDDRDRGLYAKFNVSRRDGTSEAGGKHEDCSYFVLDLTHDPLAYSGARAYANAARRAGYDKLADDLLNAAGVLSSPPESSPGSEFGPGRMP